MSLRSVAASSRGRMSSPRSVIARPYPTGAEYDMAVNVKPVGVRTLHDCTHLDVVPNLTPRICIPRPWHRLRSTFTFMKHLRHLSLGLVFLLPLTLGCSSSSDQSSKKQLIECSVD